MTPWPVEVWDDGPPPRKGVSLFVEGTLGPLHHKRERLRRMAAAAGPDTLILTATVTELLATQRQWVNDFPRLLGFDPLLVISKSGTLGTLVGDARFDRDLEKTFPGASREWVGDAVGLVFARIMVSIINEAVAFSAAGTSAEHIDQGVMLGLNHPRGPMAWGDLLGWDQVFYTLSALSREYGPRFLPHPALRRQLGWAADALGH